MTMKSEEPGIRTLMRSAASAIGLKLGRWVPYGEWTDFSNGDDCGFMTESGIWNPLDHGADSQSLSVKLNIDVSHRWIIEPESTALDIVCATYIDICHYEIKGSEPEGAMRLAILKVAAEIERRKQLNNGEKVGQ